MSNAVAVSVSGSHFSHLQKYWLVQEKERDWESGRAASVARRVFVQIPSAVGLRWKDTTAREQSRPILAAANKLHPARLFITRLAPIYYVPFCPAHTHFRKTQQRQQAAARGLKEKWGVHRPRLFINTSVLGEMNFPSHFQQGPFITFNRLHAAIFNSRSGVSFYIIPYIKLKLKSQ